MSDNIPLSALGEGVSLISKNIRALIDSAKTLYQNQKYMLSICLCVYAFEEMTKAERLLEYYKNKSDLPIDKWRELTQDGKVHLNKLRKFLKKEILVVLNHLPKDAWKHKTELDNMAIGYYHRFKTNVLYVDWNEKPCKWRWLPNELSDNHQKNLANHFLARSNRRLEILIAEISSSKI